MREKLAFERNCLYIYISVLSDLRSQEKSENFTEKISNKVIALTVLSQFDNI